MAHVPQRPQVYVCAACYVLHAGVHTEEHQFRPPERCGACENEEFYEIENYPKHGES